MAAPKRRMMFHLHRKLSGFRLSEVESFVSHSRRGMKAVWEEFSDKFDQTTAGWTDEQVNNYVDHIYDDMSMLRDESPQLLRHAQCMVVYGTFENSIVSLCRTVHLDGKIAAEPKRTMYMDDVKVYLRPHLGARPTPFGKEWQWLHEFRIIRNWMAHNGGKVEEDSQPNGKWASAQTFVRRNRGLIKFAQFGEIIVEDGLVDRVVDKSNAAIKTLEKMVARLYR